MANRYLTYLQRVLILAIMPIAFPILTYFFLTEDHTYITYAMIGGALGDLALWLFLYRRRHWR